MTNIMRARIILASSVSLFFVPGVAHAQQAASTQTATPESAVDSSALSEIVVTAQRRAENLQRVPIAVTAASAEDLEAAAVTNTIQLNAVVPGLNIRTGAGAFNPFVRGIGTSSNVVENPVALYIDGVYYPQQREGLRDLADIEQVSVLKGPQGTLFGRNATGGVIQITTKRPSFDFEGQLGASIDNYATLNTDTYLTGPLSDKIAFSFSGNYARQFDGYGTNLTTGEDTYQLRKLISVRGKLLFALSDATSFTLIADYMDREARNNAFQPLPGTAYSIPGSPRPSSRYDTLAGGTDFSNFQGGGVSVTIEQDLGFAELMSISAYRDGKGEAQFFPFPGPAGNFRVAYGNAPSTLYSQEVQLLSQPGRFKWVLGAYYFNYKNSVQPTSVFFAAPFSPPSPRQIDNFGREKAESIAPFGQFDWEFLDHWTLTGGTRWTYEKRTADLRRVVTLPTGFVPPATVVNDDITFREPSFRVSLSRQFTPTTLGYLSFNSGFKSGGFNIVNAANPSYEPEKLKAYEAGLKAELFDRSVRLNLAAYYYDYTNLQVTRFTTGVQFVDNGAAAELYGLDVDLQAQLTDELLLKAALALEHTEFTNYPDAVLYVVQPDGSNLFVPGSAKGNRLPLAQEVSGTIALDYHKELSSGAALDVNVTANYNGDYPFEPGGGLLRQDDYLMLNTTLKYTLPGGRVSFTLFGKNLLNEAILSFPVTQQFGYDANYAPPRTYGVAARINF